MGPCDVGLLTVSLSYRIFQLRLSSYLLKENLLQKLVPGGGRGSKAVQDGLVRSVFRNMQDILCRKLR